MSKKKLTKTLAALSAAGCIISSAAPIALEATDEKNLVSKLKMFIR